MIGTVMTDNKTEKLPVHYAWLIVLSGVFTLFACFGLARFAFGMLLPGMREGLGLGYDQAGFLGTGNFTGYLLAVGLTPLMMRRVTPRLLISTGLLSIAVCMVVISRSSSYATILVLYTVVGMGSGFANIPLMVLVSRWFRRARRGRAAGLMITGNGLAIISSGFVIPRLNEGFGADGWRIGWLVISIVALLFGVLVALLLRNNPEEVGLEPLGEAESIDYEPGDTRGPFSGSRILIHLGLLYFVFGATYMVFGTFIVTTMVEEFGFAEATAGRFWSWVGFFSMFSGVAFGALSDRIGRRRGLMAALIVQTVAYLLVGLKLGSLALLVSVGLYGLTVFAIPAIMAAAVGDYLGTARAATAFALITFAFAIGQTVGPAMAGVLAENTGSFSSGYILSAGLTGCAAVLGAFLPKPPE
jgi:sugar phosphate permease